MTTEKNLKDFQKIYNIVNESYQKRFITISPPCSDEDPSCKQEYWINQMLDLRYCATNVFGTTEFANNERMHFHIVLQITDPIKYYKWVNRLSVLTNVLSVKTMPKDGYDYLIKDIHDTSMLLSNPFITNARLETIHNANRKIKQNKKPKLPEIDKDLIRSPTMYDFIDTNTE